MPRSCAVVLVAMAIPVCAADAPRPPTQPAPAGVVGVAADAQPPSFLNDVVPILTRQGCNQGSCHGKGAGQNGFRLSLRGYAPDMDYRWITREFNGRRIEAASPEDEPVPPQADSATPRTRAARSSTGRAANIGSCSTG